MEHLNRVLMLLVGPLGSLDCREGEREGRTERRRAAKRRKRRKSAGHQTEERNKQISALPADHWRLGLSYFQQMARERVQSDIVTCNAVVTTCRKGAQWRHALWWLCGVSRCQLQKNEVTCGAVLDSCGQANWANWPQALSLLSKAQHASLSTAISCNSALKALSRASEWMHATSLLRALMIQSLKPGVILYTSTVNACARGLESETALRLLSELGKERLCPDVVMYSSVLAACGSLWAVALSLLDEMEIKQLQPTAVPINSAISSCGRSARWREAIKLLQDMELKRIQADVIGYTSAIQACGSSDMWQTAMLLLQDASMKGLQLNLVSYNTALAACGEWRQAAALFQDALAHLPGDVISYNAAAASMSGQAAQETSSDILMLKDVERQ